MMKENTTVMAFKIHIRHPKIRPTAFLRRWGPRQPLKYEVLLYPDGANSPMFSGRYATLIEAEKSVRDFLEMEENGFWVIRDYAEGR